MGKMLFIIFIIYGSISLAYSTSASKQDEERIYYLIKAWGFLKYYHNEIARGQTDWDNIFLELYNESKTKAYSINKTVDELIENAGNLKERVFEQNFPDSSLKNRNILWLKDTNIFNTSVIQKLNKILITHNPNIKNYYVGKIDAGLFVKEKTISGKPYPEEAERVLALARYWNVIEYFYYSKYLLNKNWDSVLAKYIPIFISAGNAYDYQKAVLNLTTEINDVHTSTTSPFINKEIFPLLFYPDAEVRRIQDKIVVTKTLSCEVDSGFDNLQIGDIILAINYNPIDSIIKQIKPFISSPDTEYADQQACNVALTTGKKKTVFITVNRKDKIMTLKLNRKNKEEYLNCLSKQKNDTIVEFIDSNIAIIKMNLLKYKDVGKIFRNLKNTKAIIFDLRNYPNDFVLYRLPKFISPYALHRTQYIVENIPGLKYPGVIEWEKLKNKHRENKQYYQGIVVILVDESTMSLAEMTSMALQTSPKAVVIGTRTAGATGGCVYLKLPGNIITSFSFSGIYYPDGRPTQFCGIVPDIPVKRTIEATQNGEDIILNEAIKYIRATIGHSGN